MCRTRFGLLGPMVTLSLVSPSVAEEAAGVPGLPWVLFNDTAFQRPAGQGVDAQVDMVLEGYNDCSKLWLGSLLAPTTGTISFSAEAAQGLRLYIGDRAVIEGWEPAGGREDEATVEAGQTLPIRIEWWHQGGDAVLRLYWSWDGHAKELIPAMAFAHSEEDLAHTQAIAQGREAVAPGDRGPTAVVPVQEAPSGDEEFRTAVYKPGTGRTGTPPDPIRLASGPHLLLDDYLVEGGSTVRRRVNVPPRDPAIPNPIVTGKEDHCFQPYLTVLRDEATGRFRIWYGAYGDAMDPGRSHVAYIESEDGIHWERPPRVLDAAGPIQFGDSVIDDGPGCADPARRYKLGWWWNGGLNIATSPDGLTWTMLAPYTVLKHNHDIVNLFRDTLRDRYVATLSVYTTGPGWTGQRRVTMQSTSADLLHWGNPWYILTPPGDPGETQFYAMNGHLIRGDLWIGLVKVLRDDLRAEGTPEGSYGMGYTTLAWTRDGVTWVRDREPFFEPNPDAGAWDHAHAWMDYQLPVGDEVFIYYGGYRNGHKMNRFEERQIGLVRIPRDRYVAREAHGEEGVLRTPMITLDDDRLTVNARVTGELRMRVLDATGTPIRGLDYDDCVPVEGDGVALPVRWRGNAPSLRGRPVRLEFRLRDAELYAFEVG